MTPESEMTQRPSPSRLYRNPVDGYIFGVCAGIGDYFGIRSWIVRLITLLGLFMFTLPTILAYVILAAMLPKTPDHLYRDDQEKTFWRAVRVDPARTCSKLRHRFRELEHRLRALEAYVTSENYRVQRQFNDLDK